MTGEAQPSVVVAAKSPKDARVRRFFIVHMLAYALALPWGAAAVPIVFLWRETELLALPDEKEAVRYVVRLAAGPIVAALLLPHLLGIPWIVAGKTGSSRGRVLFAAGSSLMALAGLGIAIWAWAEILRS